MGLIQDNLNLWNKESIVFIHGIGRQPKNFSKPLYELFRKADSKTADASCWREVTYDDVNSAIEKKVLPFRGALETEGENALVSLGTDSLPESLFFRERF